MASPRPPRRIALHDHPLDLLARWRPERPLLMLYSAGPDSARSCGRWNRWTILACPQTWFTFDRRSRVTGPRIDGLDPLGDDPLADLDRMLEATRRPIGCGGAARLPFQGGWIGFLSYDLGRVIEPAAAGRRTPANDRGWPLIQLAWCPGGLVHDGRDCSWHAVGDVDPAALLLDAGLCGPAPRIGAWTGADGSAGYLDAVTRTLAYIGAGDIFQANITQRLSAPISGDARALAAQAMAVAAPWYGAYLELPGERSIVSLSPELFLEVDAESRAVVTRPIKGTRPVATPASELRHSAKDAAELHMIIDLMRNDLGRVCRPGAVAVPSPRTIETHGTVHHGVGEVRGVLREGVGVGDLLRATFPGGSVTGAPKIRAMQIIDELEPVRRGPYCGAIGCFSDAGDVRLNIAIRTLLVTGGRGATLDGTVDYGVGAGIVADSDPAAENRECLDKAAVLRDVGLVRSEAQAAPG